MTAPGQLAQNAARAPEPSQEWLDAQHEPGQPLYGPAEQNAACTCKGWRGLWRTLLWGIPHLFCDRCGREVRHIKP